ncbi:Sulfotransferase family protein [Sinosporangium album]|uniref:Sulfotransferase family protein n=1 Tax=Sinosporangium album TaxID=504805 RepID=A0A1G8DFV4_9ACTN|nr:sulfotransferase family protein [Sinosporangium album]SDH56180.1 Sulfotransferase family protein [Sinosporangium album]
MVKVIGAGFPRTGTTSMKAALERLGFSPCYHMIEVLTHPDHVDRWLDVAAGKIATREDWDRVWTGGYQATQDWPASHYWRELAEVYPEAKVVLTVRDPQAWYRSMRMLVSATNHSDSPEGLPEPIRQAFSSMDRLRPSLNTIGQTYFGPEWHFGEDMKDAELAVAAFHRHVATVRDSIPAERLLVFDVREGWEPLCAFLGVDVPAEEPFPHLNDAESMRQALERARAGDASAFPFHLADR